MNPGRQVFIPAPLTIQLKRYLSIQGRKEAGYPAATLGLVYWWPPSGKNHSSSTSATLRKMSTASQHPSSSLFKIFHRNILRETLYGESRFLHHVMRVHPQLLLFNNLNSKLLLPPGIEPRSPGLYTCALNHSAKEISLQPRS